MTKMISILTAITTAITAAHPRAYFQEAPTGATFPYIVFDLPNSTDDGSLERFVLDVDGWDKRADKDPLPLETLMGIVDASLHRKTVMVGSLSMTFYRENRLSLVDDAPLIKRRKYIYQVRTYE